MIKSLEQKLKGELVYRDSAGMGPMADVVIEGERAVKKNGSQCQEKSPKSEGKTTFPAKWAVSFDFGI